MLKFASNPPLPQEKYLMTAPSDFTEEIKQRIESAVQDSQVEVISGGDRHFALKVVSKSFENLSPVKQQQMVYAAIKDLMAGNDAPIHAIDKMDLQVS